MRVNQWDRHGRQRATELRKCSQGCRVKALGMHELIHQCLPARLVKADCNPVWVLNEVYHSYKCLETFGKTARSSDLSKLHPSWKRTEYALWAHVTPHLQMASLGGLFMSKASTSSEKYPYVALASLKLTDFCLPLLLRAGIKSLHLNTRLLPNH